MKRLAGFALGMSALLAGCGSLGVAPDGSGSARIIDLKTEYVTSAGGYVGCDRITNPSDLTRATSTQVVLDFSAAGTIQSVEVQLRGVTSSSNDDNFKKTLTRDQLTQLPNGDYRVIFDANSATGALLPTSIIVSPNPTVRDVKTVSNTGEREGSFYATLRVNTDTSSFTLSSINVRTIPVYSTCTLAGAQPLGL